MFSRTTALRIAIASIIASVILIAIALLYYIFAKYIFVESLEVFFVVLFYLMSIAIISTFSLLNIIAFMFLLTLSLRHIATPLVRGNPKKYKYMLNSPVLYFVFKEDRLEFTKNLENAIEKE
jgi:hypothetical protein